MGIILHISIIFILTLVTQIGGFIWTLNYGYFKLKNRNLPSRYKFLSFLIIYLLSTFTIIPFLAQLYGRVPLPLAKSGNLIPHNYLYPFLNRNYVKPKLKLQLLSIADKISSKNSHLKISYLDANFPFLDGFPLLPHLSHNDGRKVDLSFYYKMDDTEGNYKPSIIGYGAFVDALAFEHDQNISCKSMGYWQYDIAKYLNIIKRKDLEFDPVNTSELIKFICADPLTEKLFIEPHLKERMNLNHNKIRFHGCHSVRHDDHIHYQIITE